MLRTILGCMYLCAREVYTVGQKMHPFYFCNNFVKPHYISILAHRYWSKFATKL